MATAAEWQASVNSSLPTLKEELFNGTKTKEEYDTAIAALVTEGDSVTEESPLKIKVLVELQTASSLI